MGHGCSMGHGVSVTNMWTIIRSTVDRKDRTVHPGCCSSVLAKRGDISDAAETVKSPQGMPY